MLDVMFDEDFVWCDLMINVMVCEVSLEGMLVGLVIDLFDG